MLQNTIALYKNAYSGLSREVWLLSFVSLVNRAGSMVFPFLTIYLTQSAGFTFTEAGFIMGFFGLGSITGAYLGGWLTDKIGNFKVQFYSLITTSIVLLFILKVNSFWGLSGMAFLLSVVADSFRPANKVAVSLYSKPENITRSYALLRLAINLGFAIGPAMGGILAAWKGYDWLFYADAITCLIAALIFKFSLADDFDLQKEKSAIAKNEATSGIVQAPYQDLYFLAFLGMIFLLSFSFLQLFYTVPVFLKQELLLDEGQIGLFMALNGLIIVAIEMPLVYLAEKAFRPFKIMALGAGLVGIGFLCFAIPSNWIGIVGLVITLLTIGEIYWMPFASAWVAQRATDANRGQYMAFYSMAWATASVIAPTVGFQISEYWNFDGLWMLLCTLCLLACLGFLLMSKKSVVPTLTKSAQKSLIKD